MRRSCRKLKSRHSWLSALTFAAFFSFYLPRPLSFPIGEQIHFERIISEQSRDRGTVEAFYQDERGFLWLGTTKGINIFDGNRFERLRQDPDRADWLASDEIWDIQPTFDGDVWIATSEGLHRYSIKSETFARFMIPEEVGSESFTNSINCLYPLADGNLWVGTRGAGLYFFDSTKSEFTPISLPLDTSLPGDPRNVLTLERSHDEVLWVGTAGAGMFSIDVRSGIKTHYYADREDPTRLPNNIVRAILETENGQLWVGTNRGIGVLNRELGHFKWIGANVEHPEPLSSPYVDHLLQDKDGDIWIGTDGGGITVFSSSNRSFSNFRNLASNPNSLSTDAVRCVFEDELGDVWIGHAPSGASYANRMNAGFIVRRHDPNDSSTLSQDSVMSFAEDSSRNLWVAADSGGLNYWNREANRFTRVSINSDTTPSGNEPSVLSLAIDSDETLWIGTWNGGVRRLDKTATTVKTYLAGAGENASPLDNSIFTILADSAGVVWAGSLNGLNRYDPETDSFKRYSSKAALSPELNHHEIWTLHEGPTGELWIGTRDGVSRYDRDTDSFQRFPTRGNDPDGLKDGWITSILHDSKGRVWLGTHKTGLNLFNPDSNTYEAITTRDGLGDNTVGGILEDSNGAIWASTQSGITRYDPATGAVRTFYESDGLSAGHFNRFAAHLELSDGTFAFGSIKGFTIFDPNQIRPKIHTPRIHLTQLKIMNRVIHPWTENSPVAQSIAFSEVLDLHHEDSLVSFRFSSPNYRHSSESQIFCKLKGVDRDWKAIGEDREVDYSNLGPGDYLLEAYAQSIDGIKSTDRVALSVVVHPEYWQTGWFRASAVLASFGLLFGIGWTISRIRVRSELEMAIQAKLIAEERARMDEQLRESQKREAIGTLASGIAHDFNNILAGILAYAEVISDNPDSDPQTLEDINEVKTLSIRGSKLVRQILQYSREESSTANPIILLDPINDAIRLLRSTVPTSIRINANLPQSLPAVLGVPSQINRVIVNLGMNAAHAIGDNIGNISIHVDTVHIPPKATDGSPRLRPGQYIQICIEDDGCGIPDSIKSRIFDPYFTTKSRDQGSGLGLAVVTGIIGSHGGTISVESEPGEGTTFTLRFPTTEKTATSKNSDIALVQHGRSQKIAIVDDEPAIARVAQRILTRFNYDVVVYNSPMELLVALNRDPDLVELVLTDYTMPDMTGTELISRLHRIRPELPCVLMSGATDRWNDERAKEAGASDWLVKPFQAKDLAAVIQRNLQPR